MSSHDKAIKPSTGSQEAPTSFSSLPSELVSKIIDYTVDANVLLHRESPEKRRCSLCCGPASRPPSRKWMERYMYGEDCDTEETEPFDDFWHIDNDCDEEDDDDEEDYLEDEHFLAVEDEKRSATLVCSELEKIAAVHRTFWEEVRRAVSKVGAGLPAKIEAKLPNVGEESAWHQTVASGKKLEGRKPLRAQSICA